MATLVIRESDRTCYLLEAGKILALDVPPRGAQRDALVLSDERWDALVAAFGPVL